MTDLIEQDEGLEDRDEADDEAHDTDLGKVHERAMARFDAAASAQEEVRAQSLAARRFITIPGAQWDDEWGDQFENAIKLEVDKVGRGVEKIERDYRENRIVPDFRPDGKKADPDTADTLDGLHRADSYRFKSQQARDNAVFEAIAGGFGAYRLTTEWDDEHDKDNDDLRINPAALITDADQCVYFDLDAKLYDKSDARWGMIRVSKLRESFKDEFEGCQTDWPEQPRWKAQDWFMPDTVSVAEYYEVEEVTETLWILTNGMSGEERRLWASVMEDGDLATYKKDGWTARKQNRKRNRVHKYILSGAEVIEDSGYIPGPRIPIVPVYGKRYFVDGVERWQGHVQSNMDRQRLYNAMVSSLAETDARSPQPVPIFDPLQIDTTIDLQWSQANIKRYPYLLAHSLRNEVTGDIIQAGPVSYLQPAPVSPAKAALLQLANNDLLEDQQDTSEQVKANTSAEAMNIAATRIDAKSGIYLDNIRQSVQCEGEIYFGMSCDGIYTREGREVPTMTEEGDDGLAVLKSMKTDPKSGENRTINDFTAAKYKVIVSVSEATATRRDKTVKSMLNVAQIAQTVGDVEMAQAALITAVMNQDGEGINDFQAWARQKALGMGLVEPNDDEKKAMEQASQAPAQPDPTAVALEAQAKDFEASAAKKLAEVDKTKAQTAEIVSKLGGQHPDQAVPIA